MNYDANVFKEKANQKARRIWIIFSVLLSANYGSDVPKGQGVGDGCPHISGSNNGYFSAHKKIPPG